MPSMRASLRLLPLSFLLITAVSAAPGRKCGRVSSETIITGTVASTAEDITTGPSSSTLTVSVASSSEDPMAGVSSTPTGSVASTSDDLPTGLSTPTSTQSTPTTSQGPDLTTITSCPSAPTYNGSRAGCFVPGGLFSECQSMTAGSDQFEIMSYVAACSRSLQSYSARLSPSWSTCFPANAFIPVNSATASSMYQCLVAPSASLVCSYDSNCATSTYAAGEVPTPSPTLGVNLLPDPGFESGTLGNWTVQVTSGASLDVSVSSAMPHTGKYSVAMHADNTAGFIDYVALGGVSVVPGGTYQLSYWAMMTNPAALSWLMVYVYPQRAGKGLADNVVANQWVQVTLTFTTITSWVDLSFYVAGNVVGSWGSAEGVNDVYLDDVSLVRLS